jgi:hypothetical protein
MGDPAGCGCPDAAQVVDVQPYLGSLPLDERIPEVLFVALPVPFGGSFVALAGCFAHSII